MSVTFRRPPWYRFGPGERRRGDGFDGVIAVVARAYSEIIEVDALHWTKDKVWEKVEAQCEIHRINPGELVTIDSISRTMVYWFAVATEGHIKGQHASAAALESTSLAHT